MRRLLTAIGLLAIASVAFYAASAGEDRPNPASRATPRPGVQGLDAGSRGSKRPPMPPITLSVVDHLGNRLTEQSLRGRPTVVAFVPRRCNGECPTLLDQIRGAADILGKTAADVQVVVIPTDPPSMADTARLAGWRGLGDRARVHVASGPPVAIDRALREFAVSLNESEKSLAYLVVVDGELRQRVAYAAHTLTPEALAADLNGLLAPD